MGLYQKSFMQFEELYYASIVLGIIASSCVGSIAASLALTDSNGIADIFQLCLAVAASMWFNASVLAQLKHKVVFNSLIVSLVINSLIIIIQLL